MKKIVGIVKPFSIMQEFYVCEDGNKIDIIRCSLENINETFFNYVNKYGVDRIDLAGSKHYNKGLIKNFKREELKKYNKNFIEINVI